VPVTPLSISLPISSRVRPKNPSRTLALCCPRPGAAPRYAPGSGRASKASRPLGTCSHRVVDLFEEAARAELRVVENLQHFGHERTWYSFPLQMLHGCGGVHL